MSNLKVAILASPLPEGSGVILKGAGDAQSPQIQVLSVNLSKPCTCTYVLVLSCLVSESSSCPKLLWKVVNKILHPDKCHSLTMFVQFLGNILNVNIIIFCDWNGQEGQVSS